MATLCSIATGNLTTAGTWALIDSTSFNNSETTTTVVTTSYLTSSTFTPGAITIDAIAVKLSVRTGTTGTITVALDQGGADVSGTVVTINTADLPVAATLDINGGWHFFKFASSVTLAAATAYGVKVKTSSTSQVSLFSTTANNWARALRTTTTQAPVAGDDMIIAGEYTGAGTSNSYDVTMDQTATTDYGANATSLVTPTIAICNKGTLTWGTTAATNYNLKLSGNLIVYSGGTYNQGTVATPCPRDSTMTLLFDCTSNVDFGFTIRNLGTVVIQGLSRTSGKLIDRCKLDTDEAANSTSLGVDTDTGWLDNDMIAVASTTRTYSQCEAGLLNGAAGASTLTVDGFAGSGGGLLNAHGGTAPVQAEIILLTRNVVITGTSTTLQGYVDIKATAAVDCDWAEFKNLGSNTSNKRGIDTACTTGVQTFNNCSLHDFIVTGSRGINITGTSGTGLTISDCVSWNISNEHITNVPSTGTAVITNCIGMLCIASANIFLFSDMGGTITNITAVGTPFIAINFNESAIYGTVSDITSHSNGNDNIYVSGGWGTITNITSWRSTNNCIQFPATTTSTYDITVNNLVAFGGGVQNVRTGNGVVTLNNPVLSGDTTFSTAYGISNQGNAGYCTMTINNGSLGVVSGIKTAHTTGDINVNACSVVQMRLNNTLLASSTEVFTPSALPPSGYIACQKHDQVAGSHKVFKRAGTIFIETTTTQAGGYSFKMTPNSATAKLESSGPNGGFKIAVANGQTLTPTIYVYEDASYNGNRARLIVKRNDALGISADTVLATATSASDLAWEALSGTTATVTDDGTLEFVVDCDGTAGNLFVDSISCT